MGDISKNFSWKEFNISSDHPDLLENNLIEMEAYKENGEAFVKGILQPLRDSLGRDQVITLGSGFRGPTLNSAVGGSAGSQHQRFQAGDINVKGYTTHEGRLIILGHIWALHAQGIICVGQALIERGCIHVSSPRDPARDGEIAFFDVDTKDKRTLSTN